MVTSPRPDPESLARLAAKYRALGELRRDRARGEAIPERGVFRALAAEFPGALHELDVLPLEEIDRRLATLEAAAGGAEAAPWMAWMSAYHALWRAALHVKIQVARSQSSDAAEDVAALAARAGAHAGIEVDEAFGRSALTPPGGRLSGLVLASLSTRFGVPLAELEQALLPRRSRLSRTPDS